jgi:hypothetical protein
MTDTTTPPAFEPDPNDPPVEIPADVPPPGTAPADIDADKATGYCVYDETLARFVGGVHTDRKAAQAAAKDGPESHSLKVVRV